MGSVFRWLDEEDGELAPYRHRAFCLSLMLANVALATTHVIPDVIDLRWQYALSSLGWSWAGLVAAGVGRVRIGLAMQALALGGGLALSAPGMANHHALQFALTALLLIPRIGIAESPWTVGFLRWCFVLVFCWSGIQKLLHGAYWNAAFFGHALATIPKMWWILEPLVPPAEVARLRALGPASTTGSYIPDAPLLIWSSRIIVIGEVVAPLLLLVPRIRVGVAWALLGVMASIMLSSREVTFGGLMFASIGLFLPTRLVPWVLAFQVGAVLLFVPLRFFFPGMAFN
jgi:hypothetical protein